MVVVAFVVDCRVKKPDYLDLGSLINMFYTHVDSRTMSPLTRLSLHVAIETI